MAEQNNRVNNIEINIAGMLKDIKYIKNALDENKIQHKEILEKLSKWSEEAENKFAPKWVADAMKLVIGSIIIAIIGAIMSLIIK